MYSVLAFFFWQRMLYFQSDQTRGNSLTDPEPRNTAKLPQTKLGFKYVKSGKIQFLHLDAEYQTKVETFESLHMTIFAMFLDNILFFAIYFSNIYLPNIIDMRTVFRISEILFTICYFAFTG